MSGSDNRSGASKLASSSTAWMGGGSFGAFILACDHFELLPPRDWLDLCSAALLGAVCLGLVHAYVQKENTRRQTEAGK